MKTRLLAFLAILVIALTGCASMNKTTTEFFDYITLVRDSFNKLLPPDFSGPVDISRNDSYFDISIKAGNLHRNPDGLWTWDWVEYQRKTHIPWFSGAQWASDVHFKIGAPK